MKNLIIVCEDAFGLDVQMIVDAINRKSLSEGEDPIYQVIGYLAPEDLSVRYNGLRGDYLGKPVDWLRTDYACFAMGIVDPGRKEQYAGVLKARGATFETLVLPELFIPKGMVFGEGCIIMCHSIIPGSVIGRFVTLYRSMIGFDAVVEDYASVMGLANITTAHIGKGAFIGSNSAVMSHKIVGESAVVLPNSVVVKNLKAQTTVFGIPAKKVDLIRK